MHLVSYHTVSPTATMSSGKGQQQDFGRNEMAALLGGSLPETLLTTSTADGSAALLPHGKRPFTTTADTSLDVSKLTTAQTAALLKKRETEKAEQAVALAAGRQRWRATSKRPTARQALLRELEEETSKQDRQLDGEKQRRHHDSQDEDDDEEEEGFVVSRAKTKRVKAEPQIVLRRDRTLEKKRHERHDDSSSSSSDSSDESEPPRRRRRRASSSSDDDDDDSVDDRRQRLLARKQQQLAVQNNVVDEVVPRMEKPLAQKGLTEKKLLGTSGAGPPSASSNSSDSSGDGEDSSSSSSSSDSSSDDDDVAPPPALAKPLFVPKHKRNMVTSVEKEEEEQQLAERKRQEDLQKRQMESRALVAQVVAADGGRGSQANSDEILDESGGALNSPPDDSDPVDHVERERERDAWEVRELQRVLEEQDLRLELEEETREYERRKQMTDEERMLEDKLIKEQNDPDSEGQNGDSQSHYMQRFFHRGSFYMDDTEWDANDVRHKAKEYARAATGDDKIDKRNLPQVMQVKKFGFARQSTKYQGLAKEDTTDKGMEILPISKKSKKV